MTTTKHINGWEVTIGKQALSGWLAKASRNGIELEERDKTRKGVIESIRYAIELENTYPWYKEDAR